MTQHQFILSALSTPEKMARWFMERSMETNFDFCEQRPECKEISDQGHLVEDECCLQCLVKWLNTSERMPQIKSFEDAILLCKQKHGLTQQEIADAMGVTQGHISSIKTGKERPSKTFVILFAQTYQMDTQELINILGAR